MREPGIEPGINHPKIICPKEGGRTPAAAHDGQLSFDEERRLGNDGACNGGPEGSYQASLLIPSFFSRSVPHLLPRINKFCMLRCE